MEMGIICIHGDVRAIYVIGLINHEGERVIRLSYYCHIFNADVIRLNRMSCLLYVQSVYTVL